MRAASTRPAESTRCPSIAQRAHSHAQFNIATNNETTIHAHFLLRQHIWKPFLKLGRFAHYLKRPVQPRPTARLALISLFVLILIDQSLQRLQLLERSRNHAHRASRPTLSSSATPFDLRRPFESLGFCPARFRRMSHGANKTSEAQIRCRPISDTTPYQSA